MILTFFQISSPHSYQEKSDFFTSLFQSKIKIKNIIKTPQMIAKTKFKSKIFVFILALLHFFNAYAE